jgi:hypothetical protein
VTVDGHVVGRFLEKYYTLTEGPASLDDPEVRRQLDAVATDRLHLPRLAEAALPTRSSGPGQPLADRAAGAL